MLDIIGIVCRIAGVFIQLLNFIHNIRKDRQQKSNPPRPR